MHVFYDQRSEDEIFRRIHEDLKEGSTLLIVKAILEQWKKLLKHQTTQEAAYKTIADLRYMAVLLENRQHQL